MALRVLGLVLVAVLAGGAVPAAAASGPALSVPQQQLDAALDCQPFTHPAHEPVLLVHGTFTYGEEQWNITFRRLLADRGFDVCVVSYPDRGLGDIQVGAEYVVNAIRRMHARTGAKVDVVGHSQGGIEPRWAIKWWPDVRADVDDYVGLAAPNHGVPGTGAAGFGTPQPPSFWQMSADSQFLTALNAGNETPTPVSYTSLYSQFDELVQPATPVPTAALSWAQPNPRLSNILIQDTCPGRLTDHLAIGLWDQASFALLLDALTHPGPANVARAGGRALCGLPLLPAPVLDPDLPTDFAHVLATQPGHLPSNIELTTTEPRLADYARTTTARMSD